MGRSLHSFSDLLLCKWTMYQHYHLVQISSPYILLPEEKGEWSLLFSIERLSSYCSNTGSDNRKRRIQNREGGEEREKIRKVWSWWRLLIPNYSPFSKLQQLNDEGVPREGIHKKVKAIPSSNLQMCSSHSVCVFTVQWIEWQFRVTIKIHEKRWSEASEQFLRSLSLSNHFPVGFMDLFLL